MWKAIKDSIGADLCTVHAADVFEYFEYSKLLTSDWFDYNLTSLDGRCHWLRLAR